MKDSDKYQPIRITKEGKGLNSASDGNQKKEVTIIPNFN